MSMEAFVSSALTVVIIIGAFAYWDIQRRMKRMEKRWLNLVHVFYESNRLLHPDRMMDMQALLRLLGENNK